MEVPCVDREQQPRFKKHNQLPQPDTFTGGNEAALAVATHVHRDFNLHSVKPSASARGNEVHHDNFASCVNRNQSPKRVLNLAPPFVPKREHSFMLESERSEEGGNLRVQSDSVKKTREEYDSELEKLVRERVVDLSLEETASCSGAGGITRKDLPQSRAAFAMCCADHVKENSSSLPASSQVVPAVPPRRNDVIEDSPSGSLVIPPKLPPKLSPQDQTILERHSKPSPSPPLAEKVNNSASNSSPGVSLGVSQKSASMVVIEQDHDYINQDHLDAILEEHEVSSDVFNGSKNEQCDSDEEDDFMDENAVDTALSSTAERRGEFICVC